jgi:hypothetical protein
MSRRFHTAAGWRTSPRSTGVTRLKRPCAKRTLRPLRKNRFWGMTTLSAMPAQLRLAHDDARLHISSWLNSDVRHRDWLAHQALQIDSRLPDAGAPSLDGGDSHRTGPAHRWGNHCVAPAVLCRMATLFRCCWFDAYSHAVLQIARTPPFWCPSVWHLAPTTSTILENGVRQLSPR